MVDMHDAATVNIPPCIPSRTGGPEKKLMLLVEVHMEVLVRRR